MPQAGEVHPLIPELRSVLLIEAQMAEFHIDQLGISRAYYILAMASRVLSQDMAGSQG